MSAQRQTEALMKPENPNIQNLEYPNLLKERMRGKEGKKRGKEELKKRERYQKEGRKYGSKRRYKKQG